MATLLCFFFNLTLKEDPPPFFFSETDLCLLLIESEPKLLVITRFIRTVDGTEVCVCVCVLCVCVFVCMYSVCVCVFVCMCMCSDPHHQMRHFATKYVTYASFGDGGSPELIYLLHNVYLNMYVNTSCLC